MNKKQKCIVNMEDKKVLMRSIKRHGKVKVTGFGIFELRTYKSRKVYSLGSKKIEKLPSFKKISFKPLKAFKDYVNH